MTDEIKNEKTVSLSPGAAAFRTYKKYCFLNKIPPGMRTAAAVSMIILLTDRDTALYKAVVSDKDDGEKEDLIIAAAAEGLAFYEADDDRKFELLVSPQVMFFGEEANRIKDAMIILGYFVSVFGSTAAVPPLYDGAYSKTVVSAAVKLIYDKVITGEGEFDMRVCIFLKHLLAERSHKHRPQRRKFLREFL